MAHLKKSGSSGHLLKTGTGHLNKTCGGGGSPCTGCNTGTVPAQMQVDVSGITGSCAGANGTFILDQTSDLGSDVCAWQYDFPSTICSGTSGGINRIRVIVDGGAVHGAMSGPGGNLVEFSTLETLPIDCDTFSGFSLTVTFEIVGGTPVLSLTSL